MSSQTISERLFEAFCRGAEIYCAPIPRGSNKTPDYTVVVDGLEIACEVKELQPNPNDRADLAAFESDDPDGLDEAIGRLMPNRVRAKFRPTQLKQASAMGLPTIFVVHDTTQFRYTDPVDVEQALFGDDSICVTSLREGGTAISRPIHRRNAEFRPDKNQHVSAVAILSSTISTGGDEIALLRLYPNPYATVPLAPVVFGDRLLPPYTVVGARGVRARAD